MPTKARQCGKPATSGRLSWTALCAKPAATAAAEQTKRNRYLSKTRYVVEQSFGTLHRKFRYARSTYFGLIKVSAQSHLKAMCLNLLKAANRLSAPAAA
ncbi:transposase [Neisseria meningitidis]|uniref:transposase n=1 Tax=Neisseria meningitidis TaxID=487 RepID=UPI00032F966A|nr:transposase [Neisseria meningitidis]EOB98826.1 transposase DDE domain protein [Neisseria meningitidis NM94]